MIPTPELTIFASWISPNDSIKISTLTSTDFTGMNEKKHKTYEEI